jgi:type I restriction enzyme S subunit
MEKYNSYKSSGVEWIGNIPVNWNLLKLKHEYKIQKGRIPKTINEKEEEGLVPYLSMEVLRGSETSSYVSNEDGVLVKEGQILILWDGSNSGEIIKVVKEGILSSTMGVLTKIGDKLHEDFSFYQLKSHEPEIRNNTNGMGIPHVDGQYVRSLVLLTPPLQEQEQIVTYLDDKTSIIDKLISTKERKIKLLKEQRTSLINEVITKGLNPNVKMKDSSVEWIGDIPESWVVSKFKYDTKTPVQYGLNISGEKYKEEGIRFIRITDLTENGELILENGKYLEENEVPKEFLLKKYDVLFCRSGHTVGKSYLHLQEGEFTSGGYLVRFNFDDYFKSKLIFYVSKTKFYWDWIKLNSVVSTIENVNGDKYQNFQYPKPPLKEQQEIVEYLDKQTKEIDELVSMEQKKIELLKEYRQSLISEVITGKIKVVE